MMSETNEKSYAAFLESKRHIFIRRGFNNAWLPDFLFDFQRSLVEWSLDLGRAAIYADCGLGKTLMELVFAENVVRKSGKPFLIASPLAVCAQHLREAEKFAIEAEISRDGNHSSRIVLTNYERIHHFDPAEFCGMACDESAILKNYDGKTKAVVTEFCRRLHYRLLGTATPAPNDYMELGTSSECLGGMGYMDMLNRFFKHDSGSTHPNRTRSGFGGAWRFRGHSELHFWRWVCSWARAIRKPSDMGFHDGDFELPPLITQQRIVSASVKADGFLFDLPAHTLSEQRDERRRTIRERCEAAAEAIAQVDGPSVAWCNLNDEGDLLEEIIPDSVQISGSDSEEKKTDAFLAFADGKLPCIVTKCEIAGWGLNWQNCAHQTFFPSHSFEQWYQAIRRSWRFGQKSPVVIDVITSEGEANVLANLQRKAKRADQMFAHLIELMHQGDDGKKPEVQPHREEIPSWLTTN
jgi:hypothetical protein